ncbi:DUF7010 family protein [Metabacillus sp. HB246100]
MIMNITDLRNDVSISAKNGISFLCSGVFIWVLMTIIYFLPMKIGLQNILALYSTGLMLPLAILLSRMIKVKWNDKENPLSRLGLILNVAQFIYFPIIFWMLFSNPNEFIVFFAIVTGAHFFPYGWLYKAKAYYWFAPIISIAVFIIGSYVGDEFIWLIPMTVPILLVILISFLYTDYRRKIDDRALRMEEFLSKTNFS